MHKVEAMTPLQREMLEAIMSFTTEKHYAPSLRQLQQLTRIASPNGVKAILVQLKRKGYIDWESGQRRTLRVLKTDRS